MVDDVLQVRLLDLALEQLLFTATAKAGLWPAAGVHDHLDQVPIGRYSAQLFSDLGRQRGEQCVEVFGLGHGVAVTSAGSATRTIVSLSNRETVATASKPCSSRRRSVGDS